MAKQETAPKKDRARVNSTRAFRTLRATLTKVGWDPQPAAEEGVLRIDFSGDNLPVRDAIAKVLFDVERFLFYLNFGDTVPAKRRSAMAEFITRINYGLILGNFELNFEDGSVRYKVAVDFTQVELSSLLIRNNVLSAMDTVEHYANSLVAVIRGKKTPRDAAEEADAGL